MIISIVSKFAEQINAEPRRKIIRGVIESVKNQTFMMDLQSCDAGKQIFRQDTGNTKSFVYNRLRKLIQLNLSFYNSSKVLEKINNNNVNNL